MELFSVDRGVTLRYLDSSILSGAEVVRLLDSLPLADGAPIYLDSETMMPLEPACSFGRQLSLAELAKSTMKDYGRILARFTAHQAQRGRDLLTATESDLLAYKRFRTELQRKPIGNAAWGKESQLLDQFYVYLVKHGYRPQLPVRMGARGRNPMAPRVRQGMNVRHLTLAQYRYFRDVGLGGQLPDSQVNRSFRGWSPHRNRAAADLALGSGMRWQEWATVLLPELGIGVGHSGAPAQFRVQACAKYGKPRTIYVPEESMNSMGTYLVLERPDQAARSAKALGRRRRDLFVVSGIDHEAGQVRGVLDGVRREFTMSAMKPDLRRITVHETETGVEALAVFLCHGGLMPGADSWKRYRHGAWRRMVALASEETATLPRARWRWHDLRHTYALQLLSYLERQLDGEEPDAVARRHRHRNYLTGHIRHNPLLIVSRRLGHSSPATTYQYLEYTDDLLNDFDNAFRGWVGHTGEDATYAQIASHALALENGGRV